MGMAAIGIHANLHTDNWTCTRIKVNAAWLLTMHCCQVSTWMGR